MGESCCQTTTLNLGILLWRCYLKCNGMLQAMPRTFCCAQLWARAAWHACVSHLMCVAAAVLPSQQSSAVQGWGSWG